MNDVKTLDPAASQSAVGGIASWFGSTPASQIYSAGLWTSILGSVNSAIGGYYQAKSMQYQLKSQASTLRFQQEVSGINARQAEFQAQRTIEAGQRAIGVSTMRYGKAKGQARAAMAGRGIQMGVGSAAEVEATTDIMKEIDSLTINANAVRQAEAARTQAVNFQTQALMQGVSAQNLSTSAGTISPFSAMTTSLLGSASSIAGTMYRDKLLERLLAKSK